MFPELLRRVATIETAQLSVLHYVLSLHVHLIAAGSAVTCKAESEAIIQSSSRATVYRQKYLLVCGKKISFILKCSLVYRFRSIFLMQVFQLQRQLTDIS